MSNKLSTLTISNINSLIAKVILSLLRKLKEIKLILNRKSPQIILRQKLNLPLRIIKEERLLYMMSQGKATTLTFYPSNCLKPKLITIYMKRVAVIQAMIAVKKIVKDFNRHCPVKNKNFPRYLCLKKYRKSLKRTCQRSTKTKKTQRALPKNLRSFHMEWSRQQLINFN